MFLLITVSCFTSAYSQGKPYDGPEDPAADIAAVRIGYLNGNRVLMPFENTSTLGRSIQAITSRWPNNYQGTQMTDNITVLIGSEVYIYQDSIPVTDLTEVARLSALGEIDTLFFLQGNDPGRNDHNYEHTVDWVLYPVAGYFNETQDFLAQSNKPNSWPLMGWPSTGFEKKWQGEWNGRFGRGINYADLETYFVTNDAQDLEYIVQRNDPEENLITDGPRYHPRPGMFIGDIDPNVTVQRGKPWGGLGLRVALRCFQWNNPEARDMIFMEYEVSNVSEYNLPTSGFGFFLDTAVGGEHSPDGDVGFFDKSIDLAYAWDYDGVGVGGFTPGIIGMAFLESPGRAYDNLDTDEDGLLDEQRDNPAGDKIGPYDGIQDLSKFLEFYSLQESDLREHFEGDEDQDWQDGYDANGNGTYSYQDALGTWYLEPGEIAGDDVGLDGVGPLSLNYYGPDEGECNHKPDFREGIGCEPNFAATDVNESDMIGLTAFHVFDWYQWTGNNWQLMHDESTWKLMLSENYKEYYGEPNSIYFLFGSTTFPFYKGRTERISMAMLFAYENLASLQTSTHYAPTLFRSKKTARIIYERDYRFTQPPLMPTLKAFAGDGKVYLSWDNNADQLTREPFMNNINDFEGYKLYRASDKLMSDAELITDGQGTKMFKKPIFQCDLDNYKNGYADFAAVGGTAFYLGDDTGIRHSFVDENVQNGRTYYYALVAYDYGAEDLGDGISPTENNIVIELNEAEEIINMGKNVQVVVPRQNAAGYTPPTITSDDQQIKGSGTVNAEVFDLKSVKPDHTYNVVFHVDTVGYLKTNVQHHHMDMFYINKGFSVYDETEGNTLVYSESPEYHPVDNIRELPLTGIGVNENVVCINPLKEIVTDVFDGIRMKIDMPFIKAEFDSINSGWLQGSSPINITVGPLAEDYFPWQYEIIFTGDSAHTTQTTKTSSFKNLQHDKLKTSELILDYVYPFYAINKFSVDSTGAYEILDLVIHDVNSNAIFEPDSDYVLAGHTKDLSSSRTTKIYWSGSVFAIDFFNVPNETEMPKPDDIYRIDFKRPFVEADTLKFTLLPEQAVDSDKLEDTMEKIKVVPNPYVATNAMEPAVGNKFLNQRRRLMFTNIPANCDIRIFTSSGILVDRIDVQNEPDNGIIHWDLLSREDLEIAAGMYVYHIKSKDTGKEKVGKFAVIK